MGAAGQALLLAVFVVATSVWVGGYVAIGAAARAAHQALDAPRRVEFFRALGRGYLWLGTPALVVALGTGAVLARGHAWDRTLVSTVMVAALLVVGLAVAVAQARAMTGLRRRAVDRPDDPALAQRVRAGGRRATALRATLGLLTLALVVLGSFLAGHR
ncbi:MAG TPA: hypothetical protein VGK60_00995 [Pedococcus sp.]|jgi:uncharacterized membrane protein